MKFGFLYLYERKKNGQKKQKMFTVQHSDVQKKLNTILEDHRKTKEGNSKQKNNKISYQ